MEYLLKVNGLVALLFLFYFFFLRNETFFKSIRSYFLIGILIVVAVPLIEIPMYIETVSQQFDVNNYTLINDLSSIETSFNWSQLLTITYLLGVAFFSFKFLLQLTSLGVLLFKHKTIKKDGLYFIETNKNISPFSFFNFIIYNKSQFSKKELEQIIQHEKAHATQWHSLDTVLMHLILITCWFNPFVWLYKKAIQQNLEFLADAYALQHVENEKQYQYTLLKTCSENYCTELTNNFYNSLIKKRIIMLQKKPSTNKNQWKYLLFLPILVSFVFLFNTKAVAQEKNNHEVGVKNGENVWVSNDDKSKKDTPLFIFDGKEISKEKMEKIDSESIESIDVLKGNSALKKYADKGKNGVVIITSKDNTKISSDDVVINIEGKTIETPLFILEGKEISKEAMENINPDTIESIFVLKGEKASEKYGDKANNGVVEIILKK